MTKRHSFLHSLKFRMLLTTLGAILAAVIVFSFTAALGDYLIKYHYMSEDAVSARKIEIYNDFRDYVRSRNVSSKDTRAIAAWSAEQKYVTIFIYRGRSLEMRANRFGTSPGRNVADKPNQAQIEQMGGMYPVIFADGPCQILISEQSEDSMYNLCIIVSLLAACVVITLIMLLYTHRITKGVISLSRDAQQIGSGDLTTSIAVKGRDELAVLGAEMDSMRKAIIGRIENEHRAWQANSDLITAISHDIRTPLTAMIGYLDLLSGEEYKSEEQRREFVEAARKKAMELKELTDKLFHYFLVFNKTELPMEKQVYDAAVLLEQLLGESVAELCDLGYNVSSIPLKASAYIEVDVLLLKRVVDNLFSNLKKYADKKRKIAVICEEEGSGIISVTISNNKAKNSGQKESTKIGLQTCEEIMRQLGGGFSVYEDGNYFTVRLILPLTGARPPQG